MDGGSDLNIMYAGTLDAMGIDRSCVRPTGAPFHGVVSGKQTIPLEQIHLPITFGDPTNYRTETLTFEVVEFHGTCHAILGRPCYTKFIAIPNYTYLKLKMSGLRGVITIDTSFQCAYECEVECCERASAIIASEELEVIKEGTAEEAPDSKWVARSFEPTEGIKEVLIDLVAPRAKWCASAPCFPLNRKARSSTSSAPTEISSCGNPRTGILREAAEHALKIRPGSKPVKHRLRRFDEEKCRAIGEEITKLLATGFIK
ncbi:uncharacterized protein [Miscanthus floridulus]|uniref:uncharacterized protein n=1 Tax=Miscanthus floridulus TaxID=154761 RepID=UPI0034595BD9